MAKKPADSPATSHSQTRVEPEQLSSVLTALGTLRPQYSVRVYEINEEGNPQARGKFTADKCDEFVIAERYGGGEYRADVVDARGMIHRQVRVYVPDDVVAAAPEPTPTPARVDELAEFKSKLLSEVRDALRGAAPHNPPPAPPPGMDLAGVGSLLTAMQAPILAMLGNRAQQTPIGEMIDAVDRIAKMRGLGGVDDDPDDLPEAPAALSVEETFVREIVSLGREFVALQRDKRGAKKPETKRVENEAQRPDPSKPAKRAAIDRLAILLGTNAASEIDPALCAQAVAFFVGANQAELGTQFDYAKPLAEQLIAHAPGLKAHAQYIATVEAEVRRMAAQHAGDDDDDQDDDTTDGAKAGGDGEGSSA